MLSKGSYTVCLRQLNTLKRYRPLSLFMIIIAIISSLPICLSAWEVPVFSQQLKEALEPLLPIHKGVINAERLNTV